MIVIYFLALAASALVLTIALRMERSAIRQRINGANGLTILAAFIVSGIGTLPVAALAAWMQSFLAGAAVILVSGLWHLAAWRYAMASLQSTITSTRDIPPDSTKATP